jgi:hypothetical protein
MGTLIQGKPRVESSVHRWYDVGTHVVLNIKEDSYSGSIPVMV